MTFPHNSALIKVLALLAVLAILTIPLAQIRSLIDERGHSQQQAAAELAETHAAAQTVIGPLLVVPYVERWFEDERDNKGGVKRVAQSREMTHYVFPVKLDIQGELSTQKRYRGIFTVLFYKLQARMQGRLPAFDPALLPRTQKDSKLEIGEPAIAMALGDVRGIEGTPVLDAAGERLRFAQRIPGAGTGSWLGRGVHAPLTGAALQAFGRGQPLDYDLTLGLIGQERLSIAPVADDTTAQLKSAWPHPSFGGRFLATERNVSAGGFDARWNISSLVSSARSQVLASLDAKAPGDLDTFEVSLAQPLNVYAMSTRAVKYGALFVGLTLLAAFMFELLRKLRMHPVQYALVGLSIALFFLLLLALSEKMAFWLAYACAASASVLLLVVYFSAVLRGWGRGVSLGAYVGVLYAALYGLLSSESNALLLGSLLLFGVVSLLMIATRRLDWYSLGGVDDGRGRAAGDRSAHKSAVPQPPVAA